MSVSSDSATYTYIESLTGHLENESVSINAEKVFC